MWEDRMVCMAACMPSPLHQTLPPPSSHHPHCTLPFYILLVVGHGLAWAGWLAGCCAGWQLCLACLTDVYLPATVLGMGMLRTHGSMPGWLRHLLPTCLPSHCPIPPSPVQETWAEWVDRAAAAGDLGMDRQQR